MDLASALAPTFFHNIWHRFVFRIKFGSKAKLSRWSICPSCALLHSALSSIRIMF